MAAEELRPHAVKAREGAKSLLIDFRIPGYASGTDQQERVEKGVVDGALQRMRLVQARLRAALVDLPRRTSLLQRDLGTGLYLQVLPIDLDLLRMVCFAQDQPGQVLRFDVVCLTAVASLFVNLGAFVM